MDELIKQLDIRGMSWRSLLLAGVLPAALFLIFLRWYDSGWNGCLQLIQTLGELKTEWKNDLQTLAGFVVLSALFVTLRSSIFAFYRRLPIPLLHNWSLRRYAGKRRKAESSKDKALWNISVARWHERGFASDVFVADIERLKLAATKPTEFSTKSETLRNEVVRWKWFCLWRPSRLHKALGWLYVKAAARNAVAKRATEIAAKQAGQNDEANWSQAQNDLKRGAVAERAAKIAKDPTLQKVSGQDNNANWYQAEQELENQEVNTNDVAKRAVEIANYRNWCEAQRELGFDAPGQWVTEELERWKKLCQDQPRARKRVESLNRGELYDAYSRAFRISATFPQAEWVEATSLGNTMSALEDYSVRRYGIDTNLLWSRVEKVIPSGQRDEVYASQIAVYALLNSAAASTLAGFICLVKLGLTVSLRRQDLLDRLLTLITAFFLAWVFVRFAVYASGQLRYQMESRIDLYAPRLLAALGLVPKDVNERRQMAASLGLFFNGAKLDMQNFNLQPITDPVLSFEKSK